MVCLLIDIMDSIMSLSFILAIEGPFVFLMYQNDAKIGVSLLYTLRNIATNLPS